jgi:hypothetical protein
MEPRSGKRRPVWTASSPKTGPKWALKGLIDVSTMSHGSTPIVEKFFLLSSFPDSKRADSPKSVVNPFYVSEYGRFLFGANYAIL